MKHIVVVHYPTLRAVSEPVTHFNRELRHLISDLWYALEHSRVPGVGLAAAQIGVAQRVFILRTEKKRYTAFVNPEIEWRSAELGTGKTPNGDIFLEGCLSIPRLYAPVIRPLAIDVTYYDEYGTLHRVHLEEPFSRYFQHEYDHLNGVLFTDHVLAQQGRLYAVNDRNELEEVSLDLIA